MPITHLKVSAVADNLAAPGLVQPSEWNASHVIGALGTPAADGIAFPAVQVPSAGVNTLDDYEEGSWTPSIIFATMGDLAIAYTTQQGIYTKVGNLVTAHAYIVTSSFVYTTASGLVSVAGFPFSAVTAPRQSGVLLAGGWTETSVSSLGFWLNTTNAALFRSKSGVAAGQFAAGQWPTGAAVVLYLAITYRT